MIAVLWTTALASSPQVRFVGDVLAQSVESIGGSERTITRIVVQECLLGSCVAELSVVGPGPMALVVDPGGTSWGPRLPPSGRVLVTGTWGAAGFQVARPRESVLVDGPGGPADTLGNPWACRSGPTSAQFSPGLYPDRGQTFDQLLACVRQLP